jgi:hypothetical protein
MKIASLSKADWNPRIYLDLDGVVADLRNAIETRTGQLLESVSKRTILQVILETPNFWGRLKKTNDCDVLWEYLKSHKPTILTGKVSADPLCETGKRLWVFENLGTEDVIVTKGVLKHTFGKPGDILIDDTERNIRLWREMGGIGILHTSAAETIIELKKIGVR